MKHNKDTVSEYPQRQWNHGGIRLDLRKPQHHD